MSNKKKVQNQKQQKKQKVRGTALTILLVIMALHGIFATILYYTVRTQEADLNRPAILTVMVLHSLANVIAAYGIWKWKKWALHLYAISTVAAIVVGLLTVGIWSLWYMFLPLVIVGWVLRTKWDYFEET